MFGVCIVVSFGRENASRAAHATHVCRNLCVGPCLPSSRSGSDDAQGCSSLPTPSRAPTRTWCGARAHDRKMPKAAAHLVCSFGLLGEAVTAVILTFSHVFSHLGCVACLL
eukprot:6205480-Pleurochrysis_carterae.AAC.5